MLRRDEGATIDEVASATGWQRHTVRGDYAFLMRHPAIKFQNFGLPAITRTGS
jgi:hypothetical protein